MNSWNAIRVGLLEVWTHKFRSLLTALGVVLGVSSLVAMSALIKGMENGMKEALIAIGGVEKVEVYATSVPWHQSHLADQAIGCTIQDVQALERGAPLIEMVTPEIRVNDIKVTRGHNTIIPWSFIGTSPNALEMNHHVLAHGRMFNEVDNETARNVCVIGTAIRDALFGSPEQMDREIVPLGERININGQPFTIIGMFQHYESEQERKAREQMIHAVKTVSASAPRRRAGYDARRTTQRIYSNKNATIYAPLNTAWTKLRPVYDLAETADSRLTSFSLKVRDAGLLDLSLQQARNVLIHTHKGIEDFSFHTQENWEDRVKSATRNARLSGGLIATISLLVGGIGIMNIMLASITERIREIGIRKAIGATNFNIFVQVLLESTVIAVFGGLMGLLASYGMVRFLAMISPTDNTPVITPHAMMIAFAFSAGVGILAGLVPGFKAAKLHPIEALRQE